MAQILAYVPADVKFLFNKIKSELDPHFELENIENTFDYNTDKLVSVAAVFLMTWSINFRSRDD